MIGNLIANFGYGDYGHHSTILGTSNRRGTVIKNLVDKPCFSGWFCLSPVSGLWLSSEGVAIISVGVVAIHQRDKKAGGIFQTLS
jgi:hypothetical protein